MRYACTLVVLGLLACAKANAPSARQVEPEPPAVQAESSAGSPDASQPTDSQAAPAGAAAIEPPTAPPTAPGPMLSCPAHPVPGDACDLAQTGPCRVSHCGVSSLVECVAGVWSLMPVSGAFQSSPLDFECAAEAEASASFCELEAQCCGQAIAQPTGCAMGGCALCPPDEPVEGAPCSLPPACDDQPAPRVIDCYYPCCCYGGATWAQCTGERWHLTSDCSSK